MALQAKLQREEGKEDQFIATFTNGTVQQLKDLADFLKKKGFDIPDNEEEKLLKVLTVGIGWLESLKSNKKNS